MRISGGDARGITLKVPKGTRPASEKVRQAIFSSIAAHVPDARVLDLYAGSGAYGLEALSRGATSATFVDQGADAVSTISANAKAAGLEADVTVRKAPVTRFVRDISGSYDLVFIDPPYNDPLGSLLEQVIGALSDDAKVIVERRYKAEAAPVVEGLVVEADRRYGDTRILVFIRGDTG